MNLQFWTNAAMGWLAVNVLLAVGWGAGLIAQEVVVRLRSGLRARQRAARRARQQLEQRREQPTRMLTFTGGDRGKSA